MWRLYLFLGTALVADVVFTVMLIFLVCGSVHAEEVPHRCLQLRSDFVRFSRFVWGPDAPASDLAAQAQQESDCNANARSSVGAQGVGQVMPGTAHDLVREHPQLGPIDVTDSVWGVHALIYYDHDLWSMFHARNNCQHMGKALAAYNSGPGWIMKMERVAKAKHLDPGTYFGAVELMEVGRSAASDAQNRAYPRRIMFMYEPAYINAGFGPGVAEGRGSCS